MYCIIDIETGNVEGKALEIEQMYLPMGNTKNPDLIKKKRESMKKGTCDLSPIWCIGAKCPGNTFIFSTATLTPEEIQGFTDIGIHNIIAESEQELLPMLASFFEMLNGDRLVTCGGFDIYKLRSAFVRYSLPVPRTLFKNKHTDLMQAFKNYSTNQSGFYKLEEMCAKFNIPFSKAIPGHLIHKFIQYGFHALLVFYNALDLMAEEVLFQKMYKGTYFDQKRTQAKDREALTRTQRGF